MKKKFVSVAIDGPAGAGKSTVAKRVADILGFKSLNSGELYRATAVKYLRTGASLATESDRIKFVNSLNIEIKYKGKEQFTFLDGKDVTDILHTKEVSKAASVVSEFRVIREKMIDIQREVCNKNNIVADGRDIGTYVLPDADYKFYLTASIEARAKRRLLELLQDGDKTVTFDRIVADINMRDYADSQREFGAMRRADDAILVDTTYKTIDEVVDLIIDVVKG